MNGADKEINLGVNSVASGRGGQSLIARSWVGN